MLMAQIVSLQAPPRLNPQTSLGGDKDSDRALSTPGLKNASRFGQGRLLWYSGNESSTVCRARIGRTWPNPNYKSPEGEFNSWNSQGAGNAPPWSGNDGAAQQSFQYPPPAAQPPWNSNPNPSWNSSGAQSTWGGGAQTPPWNPATSQPPNQPWSHDTSSPPFTPTGNVHNNGGSSDASTAVIDVTNPSPPGASDPSGSGPVTGHGSSSPAGATSTTDTPATGGLAPQKLYRDEDGWPSPLLDPDYKPSDESFSSGSFRSSSFGKGVGKTWPNPNYKPQPGDNYVYSSGGSSFSKYGSGKTWPNPNYKPEMSDGRDNFVSFSKGSGKTWPNPNYKPQPGDPPFVSGSGKGGTGKTWPNPNYKGDDPTYVWGGGGKGSGKTWPNPNYKGPPPIYVTGGGKGGGKVWPNPDYKGPPVGPEFAGSTKKGGKTWPNPNYKGDDPTYVRGGKGSGKTYPNPNVKPLPGENPWNVRW